MINILILLVFFCTGAAALVYEVIWTRYLTLMFGSTIQAQTVVLAVFMGGLALGNRWVGKWADRVRNPLLIYGCFEAVVGLYAFCFPWFYATGDRIFILAGSHLLYQSGWLLALKGTLSLGLLLFPTVLMGGTLPLLAAWLARESLDAGRWSARFYSTNSLGAVLGAWLAGFILIREWGIEFSLQLTAFSNIAAGLTVAALAHKQASEMPSTVAKQDCPVDLDEKPRFFMRMVCMTVALTGAVSMGLEVLASRSLAMIVGGSLQAFAIVLMAFILGIGAGSAVIASPRVRRWPAEKSTVIFLLATACWVGCVVLAIEQWVEVYRLARLGLARNTTGYLYHQALVGAMSLFVLGVPAALNGAILPLWMRAVSERTGDLGNQVGRLLTWNTMGAVVGVLLTGFIIMPVVGLRGAFGSLAGALCAGALVIAISRKMKLAAMACLVAIAGLGVGFALGGQGWRLVLSSAIFRIRETSYIPNLMEQIKKNVVLLYYKDAADATVSVEQANDAISIKVNGKPDASTRGDLSTQMLCAHIPMIACPNAKEVFILGLASGITGGAILKHPIDHLTIAENCMPMLEAARYFDAFNEGVMTNARTRIIKEDARTVLKLSPQTYDIIISEPSNPWTSGNGAVFSQEYFEMAANRLRNGGVMIQWFHVYEMRDDIVTLVLRTFGGVFPYVEIWDAGEGDVLVMGSKQRWQSDLAAMQVLFERPGPRNDMARIGINKPEALWARQQASQDTAFAIPGGGTIQMDLFPVLDYVAPQAFYIGRNSQVLEQFDERTAQAGLSSDAKAKSLSSLNIEDLKSIFGEFNSVNSSIRQYWLTISQLRAQGFKAEASDDPNGLPMIFRHSQSATGPVVYPDGCSTTLKTLLNARAALVTNPSRWKESVDDILANLPLYRIDPKPPRDWPSAVFAASAMRICLSQKDLTRAEKALRLGLESDPNSDELGYFARIIERTAILKAK
jgi:predicted membrane-bound spermidine synthase